MDHESAQLREELERQVKERTLKLKQAQAELANRLADARRAEKLVKLGTYEWDWQANRLVACSEEYARLHEMTVEEALQTFTSDEADYAYVHHEDREALVAVEAAALQSDKGFDLSYRMLLPSGKITFIREVCEFEHNDKGEVIRSVGSLQDLTEQVRLEGQARQAQKMEAVGKLAGGIAHEFNNLLTVVNGYSELLLENMHFDDALYHDLNEIRKAGERAAALTQQLLTFSRKQFLQLEVVDLGEIVMQKQDILRMLVGEHITLTVRCTRDLHAVKIDLGQIDQVIMNLVLNARAALPQGGSINLGVENVVLNSLVDDCVVDFPRGEYVLLSVADTGLGMGKETLSHIFEPFFTTKGKAVGTGLGLSTVFGIIKQSGGGIRVVSQPGKGSTFYIYIPRHRVHAQDFEEESGLTLPAARGETLLIVEDQKNLRKMLKRSLAASGYRVLSASHGREAQRVMENHAGRVDLMITDVIMPQMSGHQLAQKLVGIYPEMPVLFISGHDEKVIADQGLVNAKAQILKKPFRLEDLARKIRDILDRADSVEG